MNDGLNTFALSSGLVGGLALFLFGMDILTRALKQVAGDYLKTLLARMTRNRFLGLAAGATVTAVIQSSSITTVIMTSDNSVTCARVVAAVVPSSVASSAAASLRISYTAETAYPQSFSRRAILAPMRPTPTNPTF